MRFLVALLLMVIAAPSAWAETLKVGGTGSVTELLRQLAPGFKEHAGIDLEVIPGMGSGAAIGAAALGKIDVAFSGRTLRESEAARSLTIALTFKTPFGLVTSRPGPDGIKSKDVAALFRSDNPKWPDGTPILINLRPPDDSDNFVLGELFPGMAEALQLLRKRSDLTVAPTDQDNADLAERSAGSLTGASMSQMISEKRNLRFLVIDGVPASVENFLNGSYPYGRSIYVVVPAVRKSGVQAFLAYLTSPAAEAVLRGAAMILQK